MYRVAVTRARASALILLWMVSMEDRLNVAKCPTRESNAVVLIARLSDRTHLCLAPRWTDGGVEDLAREAAEGWSVPPMPCECRAHDVDG